MQNTADLLEVQSLTGLLSELRQSYERGNTTAFFSHFSPSYPEVDSLRQKVESDLKAYPERHLSFTAQRIWIRGSDASISFRWEGDWTSSSSRSPLKENGTALFRMTKSPEGKYLLAEIRGENPFIR
ncbi:MAG TPA: hypothetical protein VFG95_03485 [Nitrospiria bacterium]|nr:hypothetical protein [Nitrospiria bacterium]